MIIFCINCQKKIKASTGFVCDECGYLNPLSSFPAINYFTYLNFDPSFKIDLQQLEQVYLNLMQIYHPDKFVLKSENEKNNSAIHSSYLNNAYNILNNEVSRLAYYYKLMNGENIIEDEGTINDPALTMEFLESYEKLDNSVTKADLKAFQQELHLAKNYILNDIKKMDIKEQGNQIKTLYIKTKYIERILEKSQIKFHKLKI
ncbi:Fe-S protein assembly co-chaperone HscB [Candidatus Hepatincolaceae symbiont of Richtersius coronifer]